jgi:beta-lactamase regulating signal transducer with metallopeptidase domain
LIWDTLVNPQVSVQLCLTLVHSLWQVALLAAAVWMIDRSWQKLSVERRYGLHVAVLLLSFLALPVTFALTEIPASPRRATVASATVASADAVRRAPDAGAISGVATREAGPPVPFRGETDRQKGILSSVVNLEDLSIMEFRLAPWLAALYVIGVAWMLVRLLMGIVRAERLRRVARRITEGPLAVSMRRLAERWSLRVGPALAVAEHIVVPKVVGLLQPTILLPVSALSGLSADELEKILAHELAHVRRHDMWVNLLQRLAEAVLFFNPALWFLSRRISLLREYCCDELACRELSRTDVQPHINYAAALLRLAELAQSAAAEPSDVATLASSGRSPSELRYRLARLLGEPLREPLQLSRGGMLVVAASLLLLFGAPAWWVSEVDSVEQPIAREQSPERQPTRADQDAPARISGKVVLEDGTPAKVKGWLYSDSTTKVVNHSENSTGSTHGEFSETFQCRVQPGTVWLAYFPQGFAPAWAGPFELEPGQVLGDVTITLTPGHSHRVVVQGEEGDPVSGATLVVSPRHRDSIHCPRVEHTTDQRGEVVLENLADTTHSITVTAPGLEPLQEPSRELPSDGATTFVLKRCQPTTGVVLWQSNRRPLAGAKLYLKQELDREGRGHDRGNTGGGFWGESASTTNAEGRFTLDGLSRGSHYLFVVEAPDGARAVVHDIRAGQKDIVIEMPPRRDLIVKITGDLSGISQRSGKPFVAVRQRIDFGPTPEYRYGNLIGADAVVEPTETGGRLVFKGLAVLGTEPNKQQVEVTLGYDHETRIVAEINPDGDTVVDFETNRRSGETAQARLLVMLPKTASSELPDREALMPTYEALASAEVVLENAIDRIPAEHRTDLLEDNPIGAVRGNLAVRTIRNTNLLELKYRSTDARSAIAVLDAIVDAYVTFVDSMHRSADAEVLEILTKARANLEEQLRNETMHEAELARLRGLCDRIVERIESIKLRDTSLRPRIAVVERPHCSDSSVQLSPVE